MGEPLAEIANQLERLAHEIRASGGGVDASGRTLSPAEIEQHLDDAKRRLHAESDRVVAATARVLESTSSAAIARAEREARERILAVTESVCQRIEAVDHAQERVAAALGRLGPAPPRDVTDETSSS